jgi:hypothetical protein
VVKSWEPVALPEKAAGFALLGENGQAEVGNTEKSMNCCA